MVFFFAYSLILESKKKLPFHKYFFGTALFDNPILDYICSNRINDVLRNYCKVFGVDQLKINCPGKMGRLGKVLLVYKDRIPAQTYE